MNTTITIQFDNAEEASRILAIIAGKDTPSGCEYPTVAEIITAQKGAAEEAAKKATKKATKKAPEPEVIEPEVIEPEVVEVTEEAVTAKAKELITASSPAVLRAVLDGVIGEGVKIGGAPKEKFPTLLAAIEEKLSEI